MHERRRDPRTNKSYSLSNLLRTRAERDGVLVAVAATPEGFLMGSSRDATDPQSARLAAHVSKELFGGPGKRWMSMPARTTPGIRLLALRIESAGRPACVAALVRDATSFSLDELASSVRRILDEPALTRAAA